MGRKSNVLLTTLGCLGMAAAMATGTAFAGQLDAGNTKVAAEKIPAGVPLVAGTAANLAWQSDSPLASTTVVDVSIVNGSFGANAPGVIKLCDTNTNTRLDDAAGLATTAGDTSTSMTLAGTMSSGIAVLITNAADCLVATAKTMAGLQINAGTLAGTQVDVVVDVLTNAAGNASAPVFNVVNQFSAEIVPVTSTLQFSTFQETFETEVIGGLPPETPNTLTSLAGVIVTSDGSIPAANAVGLTLNAGGCLDTFTAGDGLQVDLAGDLSGLQEQRYNGLVDPFTPADKTAGMSTNNPTAGTVLVCRSDDSLASAKTPSEKAAFFPILNDGAGDGIPIESGARTITLSLDPTGTGDIGLGNTRVLLAAGTTSHTFGLDGTTFFIPLIKQDPANGVDTFIKISSSSMIAGANGMTGSILTDDGTYANCTFPAITPGTAGVISGTDWSDCVTAAGKTANLVAGQSAKVTVNAPQANVQGFTNLAQLGVVQRVPMQILGQNRGE